MPKRYIVTNSSGKVVNVILLDDPLPKGYWPGYGAYLLPLQPVSTVKGGAGLPVIIFDKWPVIPEIGDTVDLATGQVTKFVPTITIDGALAYKAQLTIDAQPKSDGDTITTKVSTGTKGVK